MFAYRKCILKFKVLSPNRSTMFFRIFSVLISQEDFDRIGSQRYTIQINFTTISGTCFSIIADEICRCPNQGMTTYKLRLPIKDFTSPITFETQILIVI